MLVLANAVYFHAAWQTPFDAGDTSSQPFTTGFGKTIYVPTMSSSLSERVALTPDYTAAALPYKGGRFEALVIMPKSGSVSSYASSLSSTGLDSIAAALRPQLVDLTLPKFTTTSTLSLNGVLSSLGMKDAFGHAADFKGISDAHLQVSQVIQRDYLSVGEKGTEAAAATGIGVQPVMRVADPTPVHFDHPFLFVVRDVKTGAVVFESQVADPSAS